MLVFRFPPLSGVLLKAKRTELGMRRSRKKERIRCDVRCVKQNPLFSLVFDKWWGHDTLEDKKARRDQLKETELVAWKRPDSGLDEKGEKSTQVRGEMEMGKREEHEAHFVHVYSISLRGSKTRPRIWDQRDRD